MTMASTSGTCSRISRPIVPWPGDDGRVVVAVDVGVAAAPRPSARAWSLASRKLAPWRMTFAPSRWQVLSFTSGANRGMTTVTGMLSSRPWYARPSAWLPADAAMTPRCRLPGVEQQQGVARAAFLERAGALEVFQLAEEPHPGDLRERDRLRAGRDVNGPRDARAGGLDVGEGDGGEHTASAKRYRASLYLDPRRAFAKRTFRPRRRGVSCWKLHLLRGWRSSHDWLSVHPVQILRHAASAKSAGDLPGQMPGCYGDVPLPGAVVGVPV